jgi:phage terminase large subunit
VTDPRARIGQLLRSYREERGILRFIDEQLKAQLDPWQEEALLMFASPKAEHRRLGLQACVGPGKSAVLAMGGWWFLGTQGDKGQHPKGLATSINGDNLRDNLWAEFSKWQSRSPYLSSQFTWSASRIYANDHPETWMLAARTWPQSANRDKLGKTLSGLHSEYVLVLMDEAGEIPPEVGRGGEQALSDCLWGKLAIAFNPTSLEGMGYEAAVTLADQWVIVIITGDPDNPNAWVHSPRAQAKTNIDGLSPLAWAKQMIEKYGRDDPWVMSQILGKFPPGGVNALLGIEDVVAAQGRLYKDHELQYAQKRLGVDCARFGDDRTTICPRQGMQAYKPVDMRHAKTHEIAARVAQAQDKWGAEMIFVDATGGYGAGTIDALELGGRSVIPVEYAGKAIDRRYLNKRSEIAFLFADWVKKGGALPSVPRFKREFTAITYAYSGGKFMIEPKEIIKAKLGYSPDYWDGYANTFALPEMPAARPKLPHGLKYPHEHRAATMDDMETIL